MLKRTLLLPVLVAALLTVSASAAQAGAFVLTLQDVSSGISATIVNDNGAGDLNGGTTDAIVFFGPVGNFTVQVMGNTFLPGPTGAPVQMNLSNFLIHSTTGGKFTATLSRMDISSALFNPTVVGVANYGATITGGTGSVTFQSWVDPNNSGGAAGEPVNFNPSVISSNGAAPPTASSNPVALGGANFSLYSTLEFTLSAGGSMNANTDLQVVNAAVPEPMTLLLFGPGALGLAAFRRRLRSKAL